MRLPAVTVNSFGSFQSFAELAAKVCDAGDTLFHIVAATLMVTSATGRLVSTTW